MKNIIFVLAGVLSVLACYSQNGYTVKARMNNPENYRLILAYPQNDKWFEDSNYTVEKGNAVFRGVVVSGPVVARLTVKGNPGYRINSLGNDKGSYMQGPALSFVLSNETIQIEGDVNRMVLATVKGGKINKEWNKLKKQENKLIWESWSALKEDDKQEDKILFQRAMDLKGSNDKKVADLQKVFIEQNPSSFVSLYLLSLQVAPDSFLSRNLLSLRGGTTLEQLSSAYAKVDEKYKNTSLGKLTAERIQSIAYRMKAVEATAVGKAAIPIEKVDINGKPLTLESLKGKYVLLDFWGSWCAPCRTSHSHLKELYAKYKDKGFEILSIAEEKIGSLEEQKKIWKDAVEEDGLSWPQVLNNEDKEKFDAVKSYDVTTFPTKFLLDKEGKILRRFGGSGAGLDKKLKEIFGF